MVLEQKVSEIEKIISVLDLCIDRLHEERVDSSQIACALELVDKCLKDLKEDLENIK